MIILGLHFGHDAAVAVLRDGEIASYIMSERLNRTKHALGLQMETIILALETAGIRIEEIDCVALSSTQCVELLVDEPDRFDVRYENSDPLGMPMTLASRFFGLDHHAIAATNSCILLDTLYDQRLSQTFLGQTYRKVFPKSNSEPRESFDAIPWLDEFVINDPWEERIGLRDLAAVKPDISNHLRYAFHVPVTVLLEGRAIPGYAVHHHLAHAANSYYSSGFNEAAILTHDGFGLLGGYHSGMYYYGSQEAIYPLWPHHLTIGYLYEHVANSLGLGVGGGSGKLMGLAPYGQPAFFNQRFVGNTNDFQGKFADVAESWIEHCRKSARILGYDQTNYGIPAHATAPINADIAASTQRLFEETRLEAVRSLNSQLQNTGLRVTNLCLSGGTALNCPSNSGVAASHIFREIYVDPACDDGGIAIGATLAVYHSILGHSLRPKPPKLPYVGTVYLPSQVDSALSSVSSSVTVSSCPDPAVSAAEDLCSDLIIGWFEGGSECGPRALGHRSILADPRQAKNWSRVNSVKRREAWRPFAPAVLLEYARDWFEGMPMPAPYMLFNARVRGDLLPAVTHVDGTARIQTVDESSGIYFHVIKNFHSRTGVPVVLNTSLNGPGEPIAETPEDALSAFISSTMDVLYLDGWRVSRSQIR